MRLWRNVMPTYSAHTHRLRDNSPPQPSSLADQFLAVRAQTEALAKPLTPEDCQLQSMPDASPTKWHLAHLTWFFETFILEKFEPGFEPFDARFRVLFNSYYNGIGDKHPRGQGARLSRQHRDNPIISFSMFAKVNFATACGEMIRLERIRFHDSGSAL